MVAGQEKYKAFQGKTKVRQIVFNTGDVFLSPFYVCVSWVLWHPAAGICYG